MGFLEPLDTDVCQGLIAWYQATGDVAAKQKVVRHNLGYVQQQAARIGQDYDQGDCFQAGVEGLLKAIDKYDTGHESGAKLLTYASWYIRREIWMQLRHKHHHVYVPQHLAQEYSRGAKEADDPAAIARQSERLDADKAQTIQAIRRIMSLEQSIGDDLDDPNLKDFVDDQVEETLEARNLREHCVALCRDYAATLDRPAHRLIWHARIVPDDPMTLQEIGEHMDLTRERVRQMGTQIKHRFKKFLRNHENPFL